MTVKVIIPFILMSFLFAGCKEEFSPPATAASYDFLVVDGFINAGNTPTNFKLSRTLKLKDTITYKPERGAAMSIEGENGFSSSLREDSAGSYSGGPYNFIAGNKYRVHVTTTNGKEYLSDFVSVNIAPPIDSIFWERNNAG
ncbi:MAG: DUF4249 domain-containing protein, partial [Bacteroidota bacterium]